MSKEPKKVILIEGCVSNTLQALAAAYGAGLIKQGGIAGEYPPPPVDMPNITVTKALDGKLEVAGTVTGRWTHNKPPFHELYGGNPVKLGADQDYRPASLVEADWSKLESRVLTWWAGKGNPTKPEPRVVAKVNLKDMLAQAKVADDMMAEWEAVLIADGYVRGTGACHDEWTKVEDPDASE